MKQTTQAALDFGAVGETSRATSPRAKAARELTQALEVVASERRATGLHLCDRCKRIASSAKCGWCGKRQGSGAGGGRSE